jgi:peptidyl-prolyl cis-trans isomerase-like 3
LETQNFLALCASGGYDLTPIHRIIPNFIFQTGSPASDPKSKTSPSIWGGSFDDEIRPSLRHNARGIVSMANKGPNTNGSQFFILFSPQPQLDGKNTVFGRVIEGLETLDKIEKVGVDGKGRPKEKVAVRDVTIHANHLA